jgi:putative hydrolase of the HAD superfamily
MAIEVVFFDIDNTLLDFMKFKKATARASAYAMVEKGLPESVDNVYQRIFDIYENPKYGIEYTRTYTRVVEPFCLNENVAQVIIQAGLLAHGEMKMNSLSPYPDVIPTLEIIRGIARLGIISDAPRIKAVNRLVICDLDHLFEIDKMVTKTDTGVRKPDPAPFLLACKRFGTNPKKCMMVGDNPRRDVIGAQGVGMIGVHAAQGCTWKIPKNFRPDFVLRRFKDLPEIIRKAA